MKKKSSGIVLPRKDKDGNQYLSYSQINSWKRSKRDYIRSYFFGERFEGNAYTDFGSKVGEALENNNFEGFTDDEKKVMLSIPRLDEFEREIKLNMGDFYVTGYIDSNDKDLKHLIDYKTGDIEKKRGEYESDDYMQLHIYAAAIKQETGRMPKKAEVVLIDRTGNAFKGEELKLGSKYEVIPKKITAKSLKDTISVVHKVAKEISDYYKVFLELNKEY